MTPSKKRSTKKTPQEGHEVFKVALEMLECKQKIKKQIKNRLKFDDISEKEKMFLESLSKLFCKPDEYEALNKRTKTIIKKRVRSK